MAITVDRPNYIIQVPRAYMTLIQSTPVEIRQLDTNAFRLVLRDLDDDENGRTWPVTHDHNTDVVIGGINYARQVLIREPYTVTFENGLYVAQLTGSNNNVLSRTNKNQVSVESNNSAGLISSADVEYAAFEGAVHIDVLLTENIGTAHPLGTPRKKSGNVSDALLINAFRGFDELMIHSDMVLNGGNNFNGFTIRGASHVNTNITLTDSAQLNNVKIFDAIVAGILDGGTELKDCIIDDLSFFNGHIHSCGLLGKITLGGGFLAFIENCKTVDPTSIAEINLGGAGQNLAMPGFEGLSYFENSTSPDNFIGIGLRAGVAVLRSTITHGTVHISGTGRLEDESGNLITSGIWNGNVTVINTLENAEHTAKHVWQSVLSDYPTQGTAGYILDKTKYLKRSVYVDPELITNGDGSSGNPFNNIGDTIDFAEAHNLREITALTEITIDRNLKNFIITGIGTPVINCGGFVLKGSEFRHCTMRGLYVDSIIVQESVLDNGFYLNGFFENCAAKGTLICVDGGNVLLKDCAGLTVVTISMNGIGSSILKISNQTGELIITDCNNVSDDLNIGITEGKLTLDSTCDNGNIDVYGSAFYTNNSTGATVNSDALVENLIWNKTLP